MSEAEILVLMHVVARDDGASIARIAKKLAISQSQLLRALVILGHSESLPGLGLIELRGDSPARLFMTEAGRQWLDQRHEA